MKSDSILLVVPNLGWINEELIRTIMQWMPRYKLEFLSLPNIKPITRARNVAVDYFLKGSRDYLFLVDADVIPPIDAIERLLRLNVSVSTIPSLVLNGRKFITNVYKHIHGNEYVPIKEGNPDAFGFGCVFIRREVFLKMKNPYFYNTPERVCEDIMFCEDIRKLGFRLGCDFSSICKNIKEIKCPM